MNFRAVNDIGMTNGTRTAFVEAVATDCRAKIQAFNISASLLLILVVLCSIV